MTKYFNIFMLTYLFLQNVLKSKKEAIGLILLNGNFEWSGRDENEDCYEREV